MIPFLLGILVTHRKVTSQRDIGLAVDRIQNRFREAGETVLCEQLIGITVTHHHAQPIFLLVDGNWKIDSLLPEYETWRTNKQAEDQPRPAEQDVIPLHVQLHYHTS